MENFTARLVDREEACRREREFDDGPFIEPGWPWGIGPEIYEKMASGVVGLRQLENDVLLKDGTHKRYEVVDDAGNGFVIPDFFIKEIVTEGNEAKSDAEIH